MGYKGAAWYWQSRRDICAFSNMRKAPRMVINPFFCECAATLISVFYRLLSSFAGVPANARCGTLIPRLPLRGRLRLLEFTRPKPSPMRGLPPRSLIHPVAPALSTASRNSFSKGSNVRATNEPVMRRITTAPRGFIPLTLAAAGRTSHLQVLTSLSLVVCRVQRRLGVNI